MYYTEPKTKLIYLDRLIRELSYENTLVIDFDTNFTNLKGNTIVASEYAMLKKSEISMPYDTTFQTLLDKISSHCDGGSLIVIDSLNGLIDYFGIPFYHFGNAETKTTHNKKALRMPAQLANDNHAGYKGFSLLKILFQNQFLNEMTVVLTSYISKRSLDNLIMDLVAFDDGKVNARNHFRRISNSVYCLGYIANNTGLGVTVIKESKKVTDQMSYPEFFPQSIKINTDFYPTF